MLDALTRKTISNWQLPSSVLAPCIIVHGVSVRTSVVVTRTGIRCIRVVVVGVGHLTSSNFLTIEDIVSVRVSVVTQQADVTWVGETASCGVSTTWSEAAQWSGPEVLRPQYRNNGPPHAVLLCKCQHCPRKVDRELTTADAHRSVAHNGHQRSQQASSWVRHTRHHERTTGTVTEEYTIHSIRWGSLHRSIRTLQRAARFRCPTRSRPTNQTFSAPVGNVVSM